MPTRRLRRDPGPGLNPFREHPVRRYAWAWSQIQGRRGAHLDLGIGDGAIFLKELAASRPDPTVGADAHSGYLRAARAEVDSLELVQVEVGGRLPFRTGVFASATLLDVLEHVGDETTTLRELHRTLRPGGLLVVSVPALHRLSWLDPDDIKYRSPRLHRRVMGPRYRNGTYEQRFIDISDGLVGDIAADRHHHRNYDPSELIERIAAPGFRPLSRSGANLFGRPAEAVRLLTAGRPRRVLGRLIRLDGRFRSAHLFLAFERVADSPLA